MFGFAVTISMFVTRIMRGPSTKHSKRNDKILKHLSDKKTVAFLNFLRKHVFFTQTFMQTNIPKHRLSTLRSVYRKKSKLTVNELDRSD